MKVALVAGGQPRFTPEFKQLLNQLHGFDSADLYMTLWRTDWAETSEEAMAKIEKILPPNFSLAGIQIVDEVEHELPPHPNVLPPPEPENVRWWYHRVMCQLSSLTMAHNLIKQDYDAVIRFRVDGMLTSPLNISELPITNDSVIFPKSPKSGNNATDQFAIGSQESMRVYFGLSKEVIKMIPALDPMWFQPAHHRGNWGPEQMLEDHLTNNNKKIVLGDFEHTFNNWGRSRFTDKHLHHSIVADPTE
jgi:hypothetical protein